MDTEPRGRKEPDTIEHTQFLSIAPQGLVSAFQPCSASVSCCLACGKVPLVGAMGWISLDYLFLPQPKEVACRKLKDESSSVAAAPQYSIKPAHKWQLNVY